MQYSKMLHTVPALLMRGLIAIGLTIAALAVVPAAPASAAPDCNDDRLFTSRYESYKFGMFPTYGGSKNCWLGTWSKKGTDVVKMLQGQMNSCYGAGLAIDGNYGPATKAAMQRIQRKIGVRADGGYGPTTLSKMRWVTHMVGGPSGCEWAVNYSVGH